MKYKAYALDVDTLFAFTHYARIYIDTSISISIYIYICIYIYKYTYKYIPMD